jgi:hypothetical protein
MSILLWTGRISSGSASPVGRNRTGAAIRLIEEWIEGRRLHRDAGPGPLHQRPRTTRAEMGGLAVVLPHALSLPDGQAGQSRPNQVSTR